MCRSHPTFSSMEKKAIENAYCSLFSGMKNWLSCV